ncbi:D-alanine--D-alanine ligase family protein [Kocuria sp.]|uniref:D-alanine--D-alanine ligase family protein n=1 Tax=Kocuria sp. TaxID=1871328 RepID=UPI0026DF3A77|nr:D-alanine--D-alanine ligase family protein [Kocuria sp.]MDO5618326.1 D-alanine--D-alanine ligase family protein [Kocuria sp.]
MNSPDTAPTAQHTKPCVAVLFGGISSEHSISLITARGVLGAINRDTWDVVTVGIARTGEWFLYSQEELEALLDAEPITELPVGDQRVSLPLGHNDTELLVRDVSAATPQVSRGRHVDVVLPLLHGPYGEDGTLQGFLELASVPYVGCGVTASAVGMDKHFMKMAFESAGLEVGPYVVLRDRAWRSDPEAALDAVAPLGGPVFVKPARAGSSFGITRVEDPTDREALRAAIEEAHRFDLKVVVEAGIEGREIECAVLEGHGTQAPRTSLPGEIQVVDDHDFYDFEAKYVSEASAELSCPADVPQDVIATIRERAAQAFDAIEGEGLCRADFFVTPDGRVIINEVNTMPGFTPISMYPRMWAASGLDYSALLDELITLALERPIGLR